MKFTWDEKKRKANIRKHGVDFFDIPSVFEYPLLRFIDQRENYGEERWIGIGMMNGVLVVVVAYTEDEEGESIRIISARRANRHEKKKYQERIKN